MTYFREVQPLRRNPAIRICVVATGRIGSRPPSKTAWRLEGASGGKTYNRE